MKMEKKPITIQSDSLDLYICQWLHGYTRIARCSGQAALESDILPRIYCQKN